MPPNSKKSPPTTSFKIIQTPRRRSPRACLPCRIRKVRCTVSMQGIPCVNCELDGKECVVVKRSSKRSQSQCNGEFAESTGVCVRDHDVETHSSMETFDQSAVKPAWDSQPASKTKLDPISRFLGEEVHLKDFLDTSIEPRPQTHQPLASNFRIPHSIHDGDSPTSTAPTVESPSSLAFSNFTEFTQYSFLSIPNLASISPQHCEFLKSQGCFQLPKRHLIEEFMKQYFMHVHPNVPFLDERSFWNMYDNDEVQGDSPRPQFHLLVMWAMVFAACGHVSQATAVALGFESIRAARAGFYQRAKLLFDLGPDSSAIEMAQVALLFSFWSGASRPGPIGPNSMWLKIAIHYAQMVRAHQACQMSNHLDPASASDRNQSLLRRLWWSCIVRDRSLALGLKRSVQIVREYPVPTLADFEDEIDASRVYDAVTKQFLIHQMIQFMELCRVVTDLLLICSPPEGSEGLPPGTTEEIIEKLSNCRVKLQSWRENMNYEYADHRASEGMRHDSVTVFTSTMYIYYHAAKLTLHHCEILLSTFKPDKVYTIAAKGLNPSKQSQEVQEDALGIIACLSELKKQGLIQYVSSSVVAFAALPLLLNVLDLKLSSPNDPTEEVAKKRHRLQVLLEAMNEHQPRYDGVEDVSQAVRLIANFAHSDSFSAATFHTARDWTDILALQPNCYLRLALTMDLCLKMEVVPTENDIWCLLKSRLGNESGLNYIIPLANVAASQQDEIQETSNQMKQMRVKKITSRVNTLEDDEHTQFDTEMDRTFSGSNERSRLLEDEMPETPKALNSIVGLPLNAGDIELTHLLANEYESLGSIYGLDASPSMALGSNSLFDYLNLDRDRDMNMDSRNGSFLDNTGLGDQVIGI